MRKYLLLILGSFLFTALIAQPTITSFTPVSGPIGTPVIINGSNFSTTPGNNIVFFGATRAVVNSATSTTLTVTVPTGATYKPISVTTGNLTCVSSYPFSTTFTGGGADISDYAFEAGQSFTTALRPNDVVICDLDGDGQSDLATPNNFSSTGLPASFSVLRNTSTVGSISFAPKIDFDNGVLTYAIAAGDINGDGKQDIVVSSIVDQNISVFRNTSTPGNISFAPKVSYATGNNPYSIAIGDLDKDGKAEIVVANYLSSTVSVFKNTGSGGSVLFNPKSDIATGSGPCSVAIGEITPDGRSEIVVANELSNNISILVNVSGIGAIFFLPKADYLVGTKPYSVALGDIDGNGVNDIVVANNEAGAAGQLTVYRNLSTSSALSPGAKVNYTTGNNIYSVSIGEINGDGKPDIIVAGSYSVIYHNRSVPGTLNITADGAMSFSTFNYRMRAGDLDGDNQPDLASAIFTSSEVRVYRNNVVQPHINSFSPTSSAEGLTVGIYGSNLSGATAVSFGGVPANSIIVYNPGSITAVVGPGSSGDVSVTTPYGTASKAGFIFEHAPTITSFAPVSASIGQTVTITGTDLTTAYAVSFGGVSTPFTVVSPTTITAVVGTGATGDVSVSTQFGTATKPGFTFLPVPTITSFNPQTATTGTTVEILGTNLLGTTSVKFGNVEASSFNVVSASQITVVVGAGASGDVSVTTSYGTASMPGFNYIGPPTITSFTPTTGVNGTVITITGTNFVNVTSLVIGGAQYFSGDYTVVSPTAITVSLSGGSSGSVTVNTLQGTASLPGLTIYHLPAIISISPDIAVPGTTVTITGMNFDAISNISIGGTPPASYTVVSSTLITIVIGNNSSGLLTITNPAGTNQNPPNLFITVAPAIFSFSPASGPVSTHVTLTGGNFSLVAANNVVYFGAVKAEVISASATAIVAKVPYGATFKPISITRTDLKLSCFSNVPFRVTFPGDSNAFNNNSFAGLISIPTAADPFDFQVGDIDIDGKPDLVVANPTLNTISVIRNTSTSAQISFAPKVDIPFSSGINFIKIGDMDNDGKLDIVGVKNNIQSNVYILRNISTTGAVSFAPAVELTTGSPTIPVIGYFFELADLNLDGRLDVVGYRTDQTAWPAFAENIWIIQNTTVNSVFSATILATHPADTNIGTGDYLNGLQVTDLNNDRKPEMVIGAGIGPFFNLLKNITYPSLPLNTFFSATNIGTVIGNYNPAGLNTIVVDANNDGLQDILTYSRKYKNVGNMQFQQQQEPDVVINKADMADLDGDGKIDYITDSTNTTHYLAVGKNISTLDSIVFAPKVRYNAGSSYGAIHTADLDADGKPDIIALNHDLNNLAILKNKIGIANICPGGNGSLSSSIITGTLFQWQVNTGSGFVNIINNANYSGTNSAILQMTNIPSSWNGYQYRCVVDGANSDAYVLHFYESWTGAAGTAWENPANWSCGVVPDSNTNVILVSGTIVINSNVIINTLTMNAGVILTVSTGNNLTVLH